MSSARLVVLIVAVVVIALVAAVPSAHSAPPKERPRKQQPPAAQPAPPQTQPDQPTTPTTPTDPQTRPADPVEPKPTIAWTFDTDAPCYGSSSIADLDGDGTLEVVFGTYYNDEHLYCLDAVTGELKWKRKSDGGPLDASVALVDLDGDGALEVLTADSATGKLFCFDAAGEELWTTRLPSGTDSPMAIADLDGDGTLEIVIGTMMADRARQGRVVAINSETRETTWEAAMTGHVQGAPCLVDLNRDGVLDVVATVWYGDKTVRALDGRDGSEIWTCEVADNVYHGAVAIEHDGEITIVFGSTAGDIYAVDREGIERWTANVGRYLFAPMVAGKLDGDPDAAPQIVVCSDRVRVFELDGTLRYTTAQLFGSIARGASLADLDGDGDLDLAFGANRHAYVLDGPTGEVWVDVDMTIGNHGYERLDNAPTIADIDGDGNLDIVMIGGKGTSDESRPDNYGRAFALQLGIPTGKTGWTTFHGNLQRTNTLGPPSRGKAE